jgi:hypothetical protein
MHNKRIGCTEMLLAIALKLGFCSKYWAKVQVIADFSLK